MQAAIQAHCAPASAAAPRPLQRRAPRAARPPPRRRAPAPPAAATPGGGAPEIDAKYAAGNYPNWDSIYKQLVRKHNLRSVSPQEAARMVDAGEAVLLDVRMADAHEEAHPAGAASVPAFRAIKPADGGGFGRLVKLAVCMANGVAATESAPDLLEKAAAAAAGGKAAIFACEAGGSLTSTQSFPGGKPSRSLKAAWRVLYNETLPAERVLHLEGGVLGWARAGLPMFGDYDESKAFATPNGVPPAAPGPPVERD
jgi:rhodanese-related sulfurtransferase